MCVKKWSLVKRRVGKYQKAHEEEIFEKLLALRKRDVGH